MTHTSNTWQNLSSPFVIPHKFSSTKSSLILAEDSILLYQKKKVKKRITGKAGDVGKKKKGQVHGL
jgi:hypothetical protein